MMIAILKRDVQAHWRSQQFAVLLVLSIVLFAMSAWVACEAYREQMAFYTRSVAEGAREPDTRFAYLYARPSPLAFVAAGSASCQHAGYGLTTKGGWTPKYRQARNFKMPSVPDLDWVFIISVIFSLYALLLSFRSISAEKAAGTLRLTLANPVGRSHLLLAKYLAVLLTIAPALLIGLLVNLIVISVLLPDGLTLALVPRLLLVVILGLLLISAFVFLGLLVSCLLTPSAVVLLVVLSVWIVSVIIIPNASGIVADTVAQVPTEFQTARQEPLHRVEVRDEMADLRRRVEKGEVTDEKAIRRMARDLFDQGLDSIRNIYTAYDDATRRRMALARQIARVSPNALFQYASESLAHTGFTRDQRFRRDVKAYSEIFDRYVLDKTGQLVPFVGWGIVFTAELEGQTIEIPSWTENYDGDLSDFPVFAETPFSLRRALREAILDLGGLACWNLILAALAFTAFARCDVR